MFFLIFFVSKVVSIEASVTIILIVAPAIGYFRIQQLEKDLFYYKKTSRDLKRKLREVLASQLSVK